MDIGGRQLRDTVGRRAAQAAQAQDILINAEKEKRKSKKVGTLWKTWKILIRIYPPIHPFWKNLIDL